MLDLGDNKPTRAAHVAAYLARHGIRGVEVVRAGSAFYFRGAAVENWPSREILVCRLGQLTLRGWLDEYRRLEAVAGDRVALEPFGRNEA